MRLNFFKTVSKNCNYNLEAKINYYCNQSSSRLQLMCRKSHMYALVERDSPLTESEQTLKHRQCLTRTG